MGFPDIEWSAFQEWTQNTFDTFVQKKEDAEDFFKHVTSLPIPPVELWETPELPPIEMPEVPRPELPSLDQASSGLAGALNQGAEQIDDGVQGAIDFFGQASSGLPDFSNPFASMVDATNQHVNEVGERFDSAVGAMANEVPGAVQRVADVYRPENLGQAAQFGPMVGSLGLGAAGALTAEQGIADVYTAGGKALFPTTPEMAERGQVGLTDFRPFPNPLAPDDPEQRFGPVEIGANLLAPAPLTGKAAGLAMDAVRPLAKRGAEVLPHALAPQPGSATPEGALGPLSRVIPDNADVSDVRTRFGTTEIPEEAGYLLNDGSMLRTVDESGVNHGLIAGAGEGSDAAVARFVREGNARFRFSPDEGVDIDVAGPLTEKQTIRVRSLIARNRPIALTVDIRDPSTGEFVDARYFEDASPRDVDQVNSLLKERGGVLSQHTQTALGKWADDAANNIRRGADPSIEVRTPSATPEGALGPLSQVIPDGPRRVTDPEIILYHSGAAPGPESTTQGAFFLSESESGASKFGGEPRPYRLDPATRILDTTTDEGERVYMDVAAKAGSDRDALHEGIKARGYDGYAVGSPDNREVAIFPEALGRVTQGATRPSTTGVDIFAEDAAESIRRGAPADLDIHPLEGEMPEALGVATPVFKGHANPHLANLNQMLNEAPARQVENVNPLEALRRTAVENLFNRHVRADIIQEDAAKAAGAPLADSQKLSSLLRLNTSLAARQKVQEHLFEPLQAVDKHGDRQALELFVTLRHRPDIVAATGNHARKFPGGADITESMQALYDLEDTIKAAPNGVARWAEIERAGDAVVGLGRRLLQERREAGIISDMLYQELNQRFPNYVPTYVTDHIDAAAMNHPTGRKMSLNDIGLKNLTEEGTDSDQMNPIVALVDQANKTETAVRKNKVVNAIRELRTMDPSLGPLIQVLPPSGKLPAGMKAADTEIVRGYDNGTPFSLAMPKYMADLVNDEPITPIKADGKLGIWLKIMSFYTGALTRRAPVFALVRNPLLDSPGFLVRETTRMGDIRHLPAVFGELVDSYGHVVRDVLNGRVFEGTYGADEARYLKGGGGMHSRDMGVYVPEGGRVGVREAINKTVGRDIFEIDARSGAQQLYDELGKPVYSVENLKDLKWVVDKMLLLGSVEDIGERIEMAPRVAAMRLSEKRLGTTAANRAAGTTDIDSAMAGRTTTIDFNEGGGFVKALNQFVPFLNVGFQGLAQISRTAKDNPAAFAASAATIITAPTVVAEAWNNRNDVAKAAYADVPSYIKDAGIVLMLPFSGKDTEGSERPNYILFPTRGFTPLVVATREAYNKVTGKEVQSAQDMLAGMAMSVSPVQGDNFADFVSNLVPPGASTAMQLGMNKDSFRGTDIATKFRDESATPTAKLVSGATPFRPSQVQFAMDDFLGGAGRYATGLADPALARVNPTFANPTRQGEDRIQSKPVVGGLVGGFVKDNVGGNLERARAGLLTPSAEEILKRYKVAYRPSPIGDTISNITVKRSELDDYQVLANRYVDENIHRLEEHPYWSELTPEQRERVVQRFVASARERAGNEMLQTIGFDEVQRRRAAVGR
jgi:hypothetical protein